MNLRLCAVALVLAIPCSVMAQDEGGPDIALFRAINSRQDLSSDGFFEVLDYTSIPTFGALPVGFVVTGLAIGDRDVAEAGLLSFSSQLTALGITVVLKGFSGRQRPFESLPDVRVKHQWSATGSSFPSGHSSQAFAIATTLSLHYKRAGVTIPVFFWAAAIGYGRVYLGLHYPSDALCGSIVGVFSGFASWGLRSHIENLAKRMVADDHSMGFPSFRTDLFRLQIPL